MQLTRKKNKITVIEISILFIIWIIVYISPLIIQYNAGQIHWFAIFNNWRRLFPFFVISLVNHFILVPLLFFKGRKLWYIISAFSLLILFSVFLRLINPLSAPRPGAVPGQEFPRMRPGAQVPRPIPMRPPQNQSPGALPPFLNAALITLMILGFDTGLRTVFKLTKSEQEKDNLEKEMVKSELAFLRTQVSPHFFMNTLNNIHALIDFDTEKAKGTVIRLSNLMRYLLYDSEKEKIALKDELSFIKSYVELMKLRLTDDVEVSLQEDIDDPEKKIPPLIFTSLIENAFKHGVSYQHKSFIKIDFTTSAHELTFILTNSVARQKKEIDNNYSGIGLENTRKRLDILYNDDYSLDIQSEESIFTVTLKLPL